GVGGEGGGCGDVWGPERDGGEGERHGGEGRRVGRADAVEKAGHERTGYGTPATGNGQRAMGIEAIETMPVARCPLPVAGVLLFLRATRCAARSSGPPSPPAAPGASSP